MKEMKQTEARRIGKTEGGSEVPPVRTVLAIVIGICSFIAGVTICVLLSYTLFGILVGIPFLIASLAVPYSMLRSRSGSNEVAGLCPYCRARVETQSHIRELSCPNCRKTIMVQDGALLKPR